MRLFHASVVAAVLAAGPIDAHAADEASAAAQLVRGSVDDALKVLKDPSLQGRAKRKARWGQLREVSDRAFDWSAMSQRSLGVHWRKLNPAQRERFVTTFRELLATHYLGQIDRFTGKEKLEYKGTEKTPTATEVRMVLITASREEVPLHFFVDERPKVVDVSIEGVILSNHYRGVFNRQLVNNDFDTVMKKLERKVARKKKRAEKADKAAAEKAAAGR